MPDGPTVTVSGKTYFAAPVIPLNADGSSAGFPASATVTPTITTPSTGATIAAGKRYIEFIFSADFTGTIGGQTFSGATDSSYNLPLLNNADTYSALNYTISAGSARLTTLV